MKKTLFNQLAPLVLTSALAMTVVSCGNDDDDNNDTPQRQQEDQSVGIFRANLTTLNSNVTGNSTTGTALFRIEGDEIEVLMNVNGAPKSITHIQHIHTGTACPTASADTNGDGFVDVVEGVPAYGPILVNLDGDLNSFAASSSSFPTSNSAGTYVYREKATLSRLLADLRTEDTDTTDAIVKLQPGEELNLGQRHVVVHGVPSSANLPATVQSLGTIPSSATLPIACGTITRLSGAEEEAARLLLEAAGTSNSMGTASHEH